MAQQSTAILPNLHFRSALSWTKLYRQWAMAYLLTKQTPQINWMSLMETGGMVHTTETHIKVSSFWIRTQTYVRIWMLTHKEIYSLKNQVILQVWRLYLFKILKWRNQKVDILHLAVGVTLQHQTSIKLLHILIWRFSVASKLIETIMKKFPW